MSGVTSASAVQRFSSIDALRGLTVAAMLLVNGAGDWDHVYGFLEHASWHGATPADFIFPFFLVIVGVSLSLAFTPKLTQVQVQVQVQAQAQAQAPMLLLRAIVWRGVKIVALGVALHVLADLLIPGREFRLLGVLQRIGVGFMAVGILFVLVRRAVLLYGIFIAILLAYWGLLLWGGSYEPHLNIVDRFDTRWLGSLAYSYDAVTGLAQEPEGLLSSIPAWASIMMGLQAAHCLRQHQIGKLLVLGVLAMGLGALWSLVLPMNKQLWTPSFVLWTGGFAYVLIALAHDLIDRRGLPAIGVSFGVNAIFAYAGSWVLTCVLTASGGQDWIYAHVFTAWLTPVWGPYMSSVAFALAGTLFFGGIVWGLRQRGWRFSI